MKEKILLGIFIALVAFSLVEVNAEACSLGISLLNQDPYPATPGDYVEIVFQITGLSNPECGTVKFELLEKYPITFDPDTNPRIAIESGTYKKDYSSVKLAPYKVRVDTNALNGNTPIEVQYNYANNQGYETKQFNLNVEDTRADFEVYVKDYNPTTKDLTFEILNIAKSNAKALTIEIPKQDTIEIQGSNTNIVGDIDSNEYTTADFTAIPQKGDIKINISYTDTTNTRRVLEKTISFDPAYFKAEAKSTPIYIYLFWIIVIAGIIYFFYRRHKKKKLREQHKK